MPELSLHSRKLLEIEDRGFEGAENLGSAPLFANPTVNEVPPNGYSSSGMLRLESVVRN
jgi:hypothetical protein